MNFLAQLQIQYLINNTTQIVNYEFNSSNLFIYYSNNQMMAEYDQNDNIIKEYVYLNGILIAFIQPKIISTSVGNVTVDELFYIYSDYLGAPRKITNQDNIWQSSWNNIEPFGDNEPISASNIEFNLRFPGQYYDQETQNNYNLFRDYNPSLGRYVQSDPIGLSGGLNSYAYANQNPLSYFDTNGLDVDIFPLIDKNSSFSESLGFAIEMLYKKLAYDNKILTILAHGSSKSIQGMNVKSFLVYLTQEDNISSKFILNKIKKNENIVITLDVCQSGSGDDNTSFAFSLGKKLKNYINNNYKTYNKKIIIYAPNGSIMWILGTSIIDPYKKGEYPRMKTFIF